MQRNGSNGHLVGSRLSLADIGLLEPLLTIEELLGVDELKPFPEVLVIWIRILVKLFWSVELCF